MAAPAPKYQDAIILLAPEYLPSVEHYAALTAYPQAVVDCGMKFDKRHKSMHRCDIADTHGIISLTVPIEKPASMSGTRWCDIKISGHNHWWNQHLTTLKSAYGRTPFFEYYLDDFLPFYTEEWVGKSITEYNCAIDQTIRRLLDITTQVLYTTELTVTGHNIADYRKKPFTEMNIVEYYQVRKQKHGFIPSMSVADLLFNMGTEAPVILHNMQ